MLAQEIKDFVRKEATERFLRYVQIDTTSDHDSGNHPSSEGQWDLARLLKEELEALNAQNVEMDEFCYVYAIIPATAGVTCPPITFCAHMDTSPQERGIGVKPIVHENYDGGAIHFPDNPDLKLNPDVSPQLSQFVGDNIITASGTTLLGADDKSGVAEIMAAIAAFDKFPDLPRPELRIVFTPDEEIGEGTVKIDLKKVGKYAYTLDGGILGALETENFYAHGAEFIFHGRVVHPGYAKNRMINAIAIAARFFASLPEHDVPEHSEGFEGYWHLTKLQGDETEATAKIIIRDFIKEGNEHRIEILEHLIEYFESRYSGLKIEMKVTEQYENMKEILQKYPDVTNKVVQAIEMVQDLEVKRAPVRGGTDGARLTYMGVPTPNIFAGGLMFHSKKEWVPQSALQKAAEVVIHLSRLWAEDRG